MAKMRKSKTSFSEQASESPLIIDPPLDPPTEEQPEAEKGLECRQCGCHHFRVVATRPGNGYIVRHRFCRHCGTRMITREKTA